MKKNKLILVQVFIILILLCTSVYAASTTIGLSASSTSLNKGDTVTVTLSLQDVDSSKKVESIEGYINYNTNVIEAISVDSIQKNEDNTVTIGNETLKVEDLTNANINEIPTSSSYVSFNGNPSGDNNSRIVIDFQDGITTDEDLLKIDFKVKENATEGEIKDAISYSMFVITAGSEQSEGITKSVTLTIASASTGDNNDDDNNQNKNENTNKNTNKNTNQNANRNSNSNTNSNTNRISAGNQDDNTVSGILPATGAKVIIVPAIVLIILAIVSYNRYVKYKDIK